MSSRTDFAKDSYARWCESAPYGEQVPENFPELLAEVLRIHAGKSADDLTETVFSPDMDDPFEKLMRSIFCLAVDYVAADLSDAVYDRDSAKLSNIGLAPAAPSFVEIKPSEDQTGGWPECSGDPNDCPENEGFGCCSNSTGSTRPKITVRKK